MNIRLSVWLTLLLLPLAVCAAIKPDGKPSTTSAPAGADAAPNSGLVKDLEKPATTAPDPAKGSGPVFVFPFKGPVDDAQLMFLRRMLKEAEDKRASAFIIDMDTPGGRLDVTEEILDMLRKTKVPTLTFVNPNAISAGAIISLGTKKIYMRRDGAIGAAAVVGGAGEDIGKTMQSKANSFMGAKLRAICEENGHNPDVAQAFMILEREVKIGDQVIDTKDSLLTLTGREAAKLYDGKPLLAAGLAETVEEVIKQEHLAGEVLRVEPTGFEQFAFWITKLAPLLLIGGIVGAYIEMKAPGFGIPGICSLICFGLFFGGHLVAGLAGLETVFVFVIGLVLVIVEIFVVPGTLVAGLVGTLLMLGSLLWAMVDYWPGTPGVTGVDFERPMLNFVTALVGTGVLIAILAKLLPKTSLYNRLVLVAADAGGPTITVPMPNLTVKVGEVGTASTTLRPAGKASFGTEVHDVVTNGAFIPAGSVVKIVEVDGMRVVVEAA
jgi:membrane-bound serine protease (ClpP class)